MDIEKIIKLHEMGFTTEQIQSLVNMETEVEAPVVSPVVEKIEEVKPAPTEQQVDIEALALAVQKLNQRATSVENIDYGKKEEVVDDVDYAKEAETALLGFQF